MTCPWRASKLGAMFALPNALTVLRLLLVPVFVVAFVIPGDAARLIAFLVFALAGISDWLDGFAARKLKAGSDFGRMLDPIADKVLVGVALMMLVAEGTFTRYNPNTGMLSLLRLVPALIILSREILVSGLREFLAGTRVSVPVTAVAKFKTAVQMIAIGAMILTPLADAFVPGIPSLTYAALAYILLWVAAALTVYTGVIYFKNGVAHLRPGPSPDPSRLREIA
jgi:cardiolipin synthase